MPSKGKVYLVGAGPGDPGLLTLRGASLLQSADVVVYDGLVHPGVLEKAGYAQKIYAGKYRIRKDQHYVDQSKINQLLVQLARQGKKVVRLKGGDPFIFGRGGEEASYLYEHGIPFEVVPGVTAGYAVPAYAGIPVTDRRAASYVTFVTAHENPQKSGSSVNWAQLARLEGTLVVFMGVQNLAQVAEALIGFGKSSSTLVSVIQWGTWPKQQVVTSSLGSIASEVQKAGLSSPAITIIGDVNQFREELQWFEKKPLFGKTILVTRAQRQSGSLKAGLEDHGAHVLEFPVIDILPPKTWKPVDRAIWQCDQYDWLVFTSVNGVEYFFNRLSFLKQDCRALSGISIAVIGEATAEALKEKGLCPDLMPADFTSEALVRAFAKRSLKGKRFLLARTDIAPQFLQQALKKQGAQVEEITVYRTAGIRNSQTKKELEKWISERKINAVTFTSASTVDHFFRCLSARARKLLNAKLISIGPVTSQALRKYGRKPSGEAKVHTIAGLVEAVLKIYG